MKNSLKDFGWFAGLAVALIVAGCRSSSEMACCTLPEGSSTTTNGDVMIHDTNGFSRHPGARIINGSNPAALDAVPATVQPRNSKNDSLVARVSGANVRLMVKEP